MSFKDTPGGDQSLKKKIFRNFQSTLNLWHEKADTMQKDLVGLGLAELNFTLSINYFYMRSSFKQKFSQ